MIKTIQVAIEIPLVEMLIRFGYTPDTVDIDRSLVERRRCPKKCGRQLTYHGLSNTVDYKAVGVCEPCGYATVCWSNSHRFAESKKSYLNSGA